ncbi:hypothetical protein [Cellulomonas sp. ES6]|uniref:hypothetical protein n=1 Tax=Cellulomonas sp. ES6 TaxID=3039384 RepID=UPI0024B7F72D|nr:hypothetical protein [Cellulomonas sp. ES6]WHP18159.1 hypothetical protein P9841_03035 [Cellulomonas sp. ES6]
MRELTDADVARVSLPAVVAEVARCLADLGTGAASQAPKAVLPTGPGAFFLSLAGVVPRLGLAAAKWASYAPGAPGRPGTSTSTVVVSDASDGTPLAVVTGMAFTRVRTAATAVAVARAAATRPPGAVALVGCGSTNRAVLDAVLAAEPTAAVRVLVRTAASARSLHAELAPRVADLRVGTDTAVLAGADWAFSATGADAPVADLAALAPDATVVALDGARTWHRPPGVPVLDDQVRPGAEAPAVPRLLAGLVERPRGPVLLDVAGSAVCDVALAACLPGVRP